MVLRCDVASASRAIEGRDIMGAVLEQESAQVDDADDTNPQFLKCQVLDSSSALESPFEL